MQFLFDLYQTIIIIYTICKTNLKYNINKSIIKQSNFNKVTVTINKIKVNSKLHLNTILCIRQP